MTFSKENLSAASKQSSDAVKAMLEKDAKTPEQRVENAKTALDMLKQLNTLSSDEKKCVVEASRVIIQNALESTTTELRGTANQKLETLRTEQQINIQTRKNLLEGQLAKITTAKQEVLALQRELEGNALETGFNASRETFNDLKNLNIDTTTVVAAAGGAYLMHRIYSFFFGTKEKPTWISRGWQALRAALGGFLGIVGLRMLADKMPQMPSIPKIPTAEDVAKGLWNSTVGSVIPSAKFDVGPQGDKAPQEVKKDANLATYRQAKTLVEGNKIDEAYELTKGLDGGGVRAENGVYLLDIPGNAAIPMTAEQYQRVVDQQKKDSERMKQLVQENKVEEAAVLAKNHKGGVHEENGVYTLFIPGNEPVALTLEQYQRILNQQETQGKQKQLQELLDQKKYAEALVYAIRNGGALEITEDGKAFLSIDGGEPIEVTPEALQKLKEYADDPVAAVANTDWVTLWTAGGAIYLMSRAALGLILYGKRPMPKTLAGKAFSVAKSVLGPLPAIRDLAGHAAYGLRPRGGEQWWARFASQSLPARAVRDFKNWSARKWFQSDISNEAGLLKTIHRRMQMKNVVELLELSGTEGSAKKPTPGSELERAAKELHYLDERVKAGLTVMEGKVNKKKKIENEKLREMTSVREDHNLYEQNMQRLFGHQPEEELAEDVGSETEEEARTKAEADAEVDVNVTAASQKPVAQTPTASQPSPRETAAVQEASEAQQRLTEVESNLSQKLDELRQAKEVESANASQITDLQNQMDANSRKIEELVQNARGNGEEIFNLRGANAALQFQIDELKAADTKNKADIDQVKRELEATQQKRETELTAFQEKLDAEMAKQATMKAEIEGLELDLANAQLMNELDADEQVEARQRMQANIDDKSERLREAQELYEKQVQEANTRAEARVKEVAELKKQAGNDAKTIAIMEQELQAARAEAASFKEQLELSKASNTAAAKQLAVLEQLKTARLQVASSLEKLELAEASGADTATKTALAEQLKIARGRATIYSNQLELLEEQETERKSDSASGPQEGESGAEVKARPKFDGPNRSSATAPTPDVAEEEARSTLPETVNAVKTTTASGSQEGESGAEVKTSPQDKLNPDQSAAAKNPAPDTLKDERGDTSKSAKLNPNEKPRDRGDSAPGTVTTTNPANPLNPSETTAVAPRTDGENGAAKRTNPEPSKPLPGQKATTTTEKDAQNPARPARKTVVTDPRLSNSVRQDSSLGKADLKKGRPDGRGSDTNTKLKIGK